MYLISCCLPESQETSNGSYGKINVFINTSIVILYGECNYIGYEYKNMNIIDFILIRS